VHTCWLQYFCPNLCRKLSFLRYAEEFFTGVWLPILMVVRGATTWPWSWCNSKNLLNLDLLQSSSHHLLIKQWRLTQVIWTSEGWDQTEELAEQWATTLAIRSWIVVIVKWSLIFFSPCFLSSALFFFYRILATYRKSIPCTRWSTKY